MISIEQRQFPRHDTEIAVTIHKADQEIPATMIDVSEGGIGIIADRGFFPGSKVNITLKHMDDYSILGTVKWAIFFGKEGSAQYRVGIEADQVRIQLGTNSTETPDRSEFVKRLLLDPGK